MARFPFSLLKQGNTEYEVIDKSARSEIAQLKTELSYVGMIIESTTLDTISKVKQIYGNNTSWIQHSGYVLRGATSGVTANDATNTGGSDNAVVVSHTHGIHIDPSMHPSAGGSATNTWALSNGPSGSDASNAIIASGESGVNKNIPKYKSVYIWERTA